MAYMSQPPAAEYHSAKLANLRTLTLICYALYLVGGFLGLPTLVGVVIAYTKRPDAAGTEWASHFDNMILVFWVSLVVTVVAWLTYVILLGFVLFAVVWLWYFYRTIRGLIRAIASRAY